MSHPGISRRALLASAALGGASITFAPAAVQAQGKKALRIQYDWLMGNGQIGDIVAQARGYFAEQGLDVTFGPGGPNAQTVPPVLAGQAQLGQFSSTSQALVAYGADRPVKVFACGYQQLPYAYISLPKSPIRTPQDLVGKTVAVNPNGRQLLSMVLAQNKIDPASVRVVTMGADMTPLLAGQVDAVTGFITNTKALSVLGPDRISLSLEAAGVTSYANAYFTSLDTYAAEKDALTRFIAAVGKGWGWANANRRAAVDVMCDAYPSLDRQVEYDTVEIIMGLSFDADTKAHGWGWFDDARIARQIGMLKANNAFQARTPELGMVTTHEILDATARDRPFVG